MARRTDFLKMMETVRKDLPELFTFEDVLARAEGFTARQIQTGLQNMCRTDSINRHDTRRRNRTLWTFKDIRRESTPEKVPPGHFTDAQLGKSILRIIRVQADQIKVLAAELRECKEDQVRLVEVNRQLGEQLDKLKLRINKLVNEKGGSYTSLHELQKLATGGRK